MRQIIIAILLLVLPLGVKAQMLALNTEAAADITVTVLSDGILDYGNVFQNQGLVQIQLMDPGTEVISIEGDFNKSVTVTITPPAGLRLDASNSLPFTLGAAYANNEVNNKGDATLFSGNTATFEIREGGGPPPGGGRGGGGGPPTTTAYVFIFGDINVGNVNAGAYSGIINVFVEYE